MGCQGGGRAASVSYVIPMLSFVIQSFPTCVLIFSRFLLAWQFLERSDWVHRQWNPLRSGPWPRPLDRPACRGPPPPPPTQFCQDPAPELFVHGWVPFWLLLWFRPRCLVPCFFPIMVPLRSFVRSMFFLLLFLFWMLCVFCA